MNQNIFLSGLKLVLYFICSLFLLIACSGRKEKKEAHLSMKEPAPPREIAYSPPTVTKEDEAPDAVVSSVSFADVTADSTVSLSGGSYAPMPDKSIPDAVGGKQLIKTGTMRMQVEDYGKGLRLVKSLVQKYKGYIGGEDEKNDGSTIENTLILRINNSSFDALMNAVAGGAKYIESRNVSVEDVTEEYVDIQTRLKTKKEVEKRYLDILTKAKKIPDILNVENELRVIREEIEAKEGRLKFLADQVQFSTLTLTIYQNLPYKAPPQAETGFFGRMGTALASGWRGFLDVLVGLMTAWPLLLIIGAGVVLVIRQVRKIKTEKSVE